ncbi:HepT-like ribonuclease domain-containing protein [Salinispirillum marinum]|uniref:HepT-like ribonuclease domain-containing protein n=2 Tax=Saccharospirillaceae TaxID=255527 RepID=A0ABV8BG14_9GAMM
MLEWKKIIGLRNGLVHDYLKIDLLILEKIIKEAHYQRLDEFSTKAIQYLTT